MKKILVYVDEGAGPRPVRYLVKSLRDEQLHNKFEIIRIDRDYIREEGWEEDAALLIFPGGRDVYYHQALSGEANARIRAYVNKGGKYLGICAGGYYGCDSIEFEKGFPLEVLGDRELKFFPGMAKGSVYGPNKFCYLSETGSCIAELEWLEKKEHLENASIYFNGGCEFVDAHKFPNTVVLARYRNIPNKPAAIVQCEVGKGRAVLSGVHPEYSALYMESALGETRNLLPGLKSGERTRKKWLQTLLQRLL